MLKCQQYFNVFFAYICFLFKRAIQGIQTPAFERLTQEGSGLYSKYLSDRK